MRHPDISDWTDYVRAIDSESDHTALQSHLDEGCGLCQPTVTALERVATAAANEASVPVPVRAVRSVKAFFRLQHPKAESRRGEPLLRRGFDGAVGDGEVIGRTISERHGNLEMSGPLDQSCELWGFPDDDRRIRLSLEPKH